MQLPWLPERCSEQNKRYRHTCGTKLCRTRCGKQPAFRCQDACRSLADEPSQMQSLPTNVTCKSGLHLSPSYQLAVVRIGGPSCLHAVRLHQGLILLTCSQILHQGCRTHTSSPDNIDFNVVPYSGEFPSSLSAIPSLQSPAVSLCLFWISGRSM